MASLARPCAADACAAKQPGDLQVAPAQESAEALCAHLQRAHELTGGAFPERCRLYTNTLRQGTFGAVCNMRTVYGVDETGLFFTPADRGKAHVRAALKCLAYAPVMQPAEPVAGRDNTTEETENDHTVTSTRSQPALRGINKYLYPETKLRCSPLLLR